MIPTGMSDKYDRDACSAYIIDVYGYDKNVNYILILVLKKLLNYQ